MIRLLKRLKRREKSWPDEETRAFVLQESSKNFGAGVILRHAAERMTEEEFSQLRARFRDPEYPQRLWAQCKEKADQARANGGKPYTPQKFIEELKKEMSLSLA